MKGSIINIKYLSVVLLLGLIACTPVQSSAQGKKKKLKAISEQMDAFLKSTNWIPGRVLIVTPENLVDLKDIISDLEQFSFNSLTRPTLVRNNESHLHAARKLLSSATLYASVKLDKIPDSNELKINNLDTVIKDIKPSKTLKQTLVPFASAAYIIDANKAMLEEIQLELQHIDSNQQQILENQAVLQKALAESAVSQQLHTDFAQAVAANKTLRNRLN